MVEHLKFFIEGSEVDIPKHFHLFSVLVDNYIKAFLDDDDDENHASDDYSIIPLKDFKKKHLLIIFKFFSELKDHPLKGQDYETQPQEDKRENFLSLSQSELYEEDENVYGAVVENEVCALSPEKNDAKQNEKEKVKKEEDDEASLAHINANIKIVKLPEWAYEFFDAIDKEEFFQTLLLANFILAHPFVEHAAAFISLKLKSLSSIREMREYLNIEPDFAPGEFDLLANDLNWRERLIKEGLVSGEPTSG